MTPRGGRDFAELGDGLVGRMGYVDGEAFMLLLLRSGSCVAAEVGDKKSVDVVKSEFESFFARLDRAEGRQNVRYCFQHGSYAAIYFSWPSSFPAQFSSGISFSCCSRSRLFALLLAVCLVALPYA